MPPFSGTSTALPRPASGTWTMIGPATAGFRVMNFGVSTVAGSIPVLSARVDVAEDGRIGDLVAVLDVGAIDTGHARRDADLRKPHLLDLDRHPRMTFSGQRVDVRDGGWSLVGLLTVKGTTAEVALDVTAAGLDDGTVRVVATGHLDRRDFGIRAPRFMIAHCVDVEIDVTLGR